MNTKKLIFLMLILAGLVVVVRISLMGFRSECKKVPGQIHNDFAPGLMGPFTSLRDCDECGEIDSPCVRFTARGDPKEYEMIVREEGESISVEHDGTVTYCSPQKDSPTIFDCRVTFGGREVLFWVERYPPATFPPTAP